MSANCSIFQSLVLRTIECSAFWPARAPCARAGMAVRMLCRSKRVGGRVADSAVDVTALYPRPPGEWGPLGVGRWGTCGTRTSHLISAVQLWVPIVATGHLPLTKASHGTPPIRQHNFHQRGLQYMSALSSCRSSCYMKHSSCVVRGKRSGHSHHNAQWCELEKAALWDLQKNNTCSVHMCTWPHGSVLFVHMWTVHEHFTLLLVLCCDWQWWVHGAHVHIVGIVDIPTSIHACVCVCVCVCLYVCVCVHVSDVSIEVSAREQLCAWYPQTEDTFVHTLQCVAA